MRPTATGARATGLCRVLFAPIGTRRPRLLLCESADENGEGSAAVAALGWKRRAPCFPNGDEGELRETGLAWLLRPARRTARRLPEPRVGDSSGMANLLDDDEVRTMTRWLRQAKPVQLVSAQLSRASYLDVYRRTVWSW